ncbi:uncharacterized protein LOC134665707 [Cydia fagiglandana]|uniref:uncharacterized protein LOC134665707 n=1 Tax=Cydia fagiglandana TaxID=1458189 RepID=UPI002FEE261F
MSSEGSSRLRQFGLYKTIDSQTAEFLKLSRKKQIRRGCACAAVSTAITVTVVVVILLIYEYGIAVESSLVQNIYSYGNLSSNGSEDSPVAYRLDRSYFGFDQDYYERMPLLVNAMQENHYIDPFVEISVPTKRARLLRNKTKTTKTTSIRRTSPRPFIFELRSPTPTPFSRTFGSKNWVESYRNAQRLENLQQVIQYLEKTINAKFGDLYELPSSSSTHIAFSGVYVKPSAETSKEEKPTTPTLDLLLQSSNKVETKNHVSDPLFSFKPDSPGDVNLLADGFFRFAPTPTLDKPVIPMFRPISNRKKQDNDDKNVVDAQASEIKNIETSTVDKPNSFKVMLNYVPTKTTIDYSSSDGTSSAINKVYFTTSRPVRFQFKRKSNGVRRMYMPRSLKRPIFNRTKPPPQDILRKSSSNEEATMIVHVNLYPQRTVVKEVVNVTENKQEYTTTPVATTTQVNTVRPLTQAPEISIPQVEDHHVGSSGVIPVEHRTVPPSPPPPVTPVIPTFETTVSSTSEIYSWPTNPPDVVKFSPEDAKVPDHYQRLREMESGSYTTEANNREFNLHDLKFKDYYDQLKQIEAGNGPIGYNNRDFNSEETEILNHYGRFGEKEIGKSYPVNVDSRPINTEYTKYIDSHRRFLDMDFSTSTLTGTNRRNYRDSLEIQETVEPSTLVVKLKNEVKLTTTTTQETILEVEEDSDETTTVQTYVPQINGHYRSVNQNSRIINDWFDKEDENERKKRLETRVTGLKKPTYVEIKRNNTNINNENNDDENDE